MVAPIIPNQPTTPSPSPEQPAQSEPNPRLPTVSLAGVEHEVYTLTDLVQIELHGLQLEDSPAKEMILRLLATTYLFKRVMEEEHQAANTCREWVSKYREVINEAKKIVDERDRQKKAGELWKPPSLYGKEL
jgi:hypothetical protein